MLLNMFVNDLSKSYNINIYHIRLNEDCVVSINLPQAHNRKSLKTNKVFHVSVKIYFV